MGYPVRSNRIEDIGGTTNLALSIPELNVLGRVANALGINSALNTASGYLLKECAKDVGAVSTAPKAPFQATGEHPDVFISATKRDLESYYEKIKNALLALNISPVEQSSCTIASDILIRTDQEL